MVFWSLLGDRITGKRHRRSCPKCSYDLAGRDAPLTCPECGKQIRRDAQLRRSQRRPSMFLLGLVILTVATIASYWPWILGHGYKRLLPFPIQLFTTWDGPDDVLIQTGQYYADRGELAAWERRRLASLARTWYLSKNGTVNDAFLRALEHLVDDKEVVVEELFRALPTVDEFRPQSMSSDASMS